MLARTRFNFKPTTTQPVSESVLNQYCYHTDRIMKYLDSFIIDSLERPLPKDKLEELIQFVEDNLNQLGKIDTPFLQFISEGINNLKEEIAESDFPGGTSPLALIDSVDEMRTGVNNLPHAYMAVRYDNQSSYMIIRMEGDGFYNTVSRNMDVGSASFSVAKLNNYLDQDSSL